MKKVVYSIRKVKGNFDEKISGLGFLNDEGTLFCKCVSKNGKRYTRAFVDVEKNCHPILGKENEFKGYVTMYYEYEGRDIEVEYSVWYPLAGYFKKFAVIYYLSTTIGHFRHESKWFASSFLKNFFYIDISSRIFQCFMQKKQRCRIF